MMKRFFYKTVSALLTVALLLCLLPAVTRTVEAYTYPNGYSGGMPGGGKIYAHGLDVSAWQGSGLNFQNFVNAGYKYVILRCGTSYGKDKCFEEYYNSAKAAGLDVGCYFYSYALSPAEAQQEAQSVLSWIQGKVFEYPVYFDFEDPTQIDLNYTLSANICRGFMDVVKEKGYLVGLYSMSWMLNRSWISTSGIQETYEGWVAHVYSDANNTGITSGEYNIYKDRYCSTYGMHQYSFTTYVNGAGPYDANVSYKDYPTLVKQFGFNGYSQGSWMEQATFDPEVYRGRYDDLKDRTDEELKAHWLNYGIKEGRAASVILDLKYYVENNPDLKANYGTDYAAAYNHFITKGYKEHRKSAVTFDGSYYCDTYADVRENCKETYILHYLEHGMAEGRRPSATFDVNYYLFIRPDVASTWPGDLVKATKHYAGCGIKEGKPGYDSKAPVITNAAVSNVTAAGYTVTCKVTDDWGVSSVAFPSWTANNGQDDLPEQFITTQVGKRNGDTFTFQVYASQHGYETGMYVTHIYAIDNGGNQTVLELDPVNVRNGLDEIVLTQNSGCSVSGSYLTGVAERTSVTALLKKFENDDLQIVDKNGKTLSSSGLVGTGAKINLYDNGILLDTVTVVVLGDVDGSGKVDSTDYLQIKSVFLGQYSFNEAEKLAANVDNNTTVDNTDYLRIKSKLLGLFTL